MIIYQFHLLSNGEIKISKAEYLEIKKQDIAYYKKVKVIEKGIRFPKFPKELYKLGRYDHNKYYSTEMADLKKFALSEISVQEEHIKNLEYQLKQYKEIIVNLEKYF